jgi:copper chaperone NosL
MKRLLMVTLALVAGCSAGPEPIRWGTDACDVCRMVLTDKLFGAELVEEGGQVRKFDGLDELVTYTSQSGKKGKVYVTNGKDGALVPIEQAVIVRSPGLISPMGGDVTTFASKADADAYIQAQKLDNVSWPALADLKPNGGHSHAGH